MAYHTETAAVSQRIAVVAASGAPELNPAEQVWQQLRDQDLANRG
jgi:transposase